MKKQANSIYLADKKEYVAVDILKFAAAYMVMGIHFLPFENINKELNFWFTQVFCRLAVPFFFIASGYFSADKLHDKAKTFAYVKRIALMYVIYTIIFLPFLVEEYQGADYSFAQGVVCFLQDFFLVGSFVHLWYFLALIIAVVLLYIMLHCWKLSDKKILLITGGLYCFGTLGNAYRNIWSNIPVIEAVFSVYETVFKTTVNGLFFGAFLVAIGYCIRKYSNKIKYRSYWLYAILLFLAMNAEEYFARSVTHHSGQSMLFVTPFAAAAVFLAACFVPVPEKAVPAGVFLRNMSVIIYGFHLYIHFKYGNELSGFAPYGFTYYLMVAKRITLFAAAVVGLSRIKIFSWLKYLY